MLTKTFPIVVATLLLAACQSLPVTDENSPRMRAMPGSTLTLHEALIVPAGHARVFLQDGRVVAKTKRNRYLPHCNFEVRQVSDGSVRIEPGTFIITAISEGEEEWVRRQPPLKLAALQVGGHAFDAPTSLIRLVHHRLHSDSQPHVFRLTCHGGFADPWEVRYPSVSDIRRALGARATLTLRADKRAGSI